MWTCPCCGEVVSSAPEVVQATCKEGTTFWLSEPDSDGHRFAWTSGMELEVAQSGGADVDALLSATPIRPGEDPVQVYLKVIQTYLAAGVALRAGPKHIPVKAACLDKMGRIFLTGSIDQIEICSDLTL